MDLTLLATLKDKLANAKNFGDIWTYFFDHFGEDAEFIALGERTRDRMLEAILAQIGKEMFGRPVKVTDLLLTRLPEQQFIHGGLLLGGSLANVLYFEDIHMGVVAVVAAFRPSETKMARFSGIPLPGRLEPSQN